MWGACSVFGPMPWGITQRAKANPIAVPPRMARPWGQESPDYAQSEGDAQRSTAKADRAAALDLDLWIPLISDVVQVTIQGGTRWILMDVHHIRNGSHIMADVVFNHREGRHSPPPPHGTPQPMAVCGHPPHGTNGGLYLI